MKKSFELPKDFAVKWVKALRSGKYKQGTGKLCEKKYDFLPMFRQNSNFCCLGVAGHISGNSIKTLIDRPYFESYFNSSIPQQLQGNGSNELVYVLSSLNDGCNDFNMTKFKKQGYHFRNELIFNETTNKYKLTFSEIADFIEDNVEFK